MLYISKGESCPSGKGGLKVTHLGRTVLLERDTSEIWRSGRYKFYIERDVEKVYTVAYLANIGLAELEREETECAKFRMLSRCIITIGRRSAGNSPMERRILRWLQYPGFRIGIAELVALEEKRILGAHGLLKE